MVSQLELEEYQIRTNAFHFTSAGPRWRQQGCSRSISLVQVREYYDFFTKWCEGYLAIHQCLRALAERGPGKASLGLLLSWRLSIQRLQNLLS